MDKYLIEILEKFGFKKSDLTSLENYNPRDGFQIVVADNFNNMMEYLSKYSIYQDIVPILTDNNSNYICAYKSGVLFGRICYLNHEETSLEPKFRNIENLIAAINKNTDCWDLYEFPETAFDYPQRDNKSFTEEDKTALVLLHKLFNNEPDEDKKVQISFCIMSLTPPNMLKDIYPFLDNDDMYIQERAINTFGFHRYEPVIAKLRELVTTAKHNGKFAATLALKKIESEQ